MRKYTESTIKDSYKHSPISETARKALATPLKRYNLLLKNYVCVVDEQTKDVIYLFPISDLNKANRDLKAIILADLRNNFKNAGLIIADEKATFADIYRVGFLSQMFKFKCT